MKKAFSLIVGFLSLSVSAGAAAHEFWIEPMTYQAQPNTAVQARFVNGENFAGTPLAFFDRSSARLQAASGGRVVDLTPRNGDRPAIQHLAEQDGLLVLIHETTPSTLTYKEWEKFLKFAAHKDFPDIEARHDDRGLPRTGFRERYTRHAKALVAVGSGTGMDRAFGLKTEIVAHANPYNADFDGVLPVEVLLDGQPRPQAQVEIFEEAPSGAVTVRLTQTDDRGFARIDTKPGHEYLLDAVTLEASDPESTQAAWTTYWAALTFAVPDQ